MQTFWAEYGFYLWALTTALAIITLVWLGYNTFSRADEGEPAEAAVEADRALEALAAQVEELHEGAPHMRATLGRTLQFFGLECSTNADGDPAFALAVVNARGDGFLLSSASRRELTAQPLVNWSVRSPAPLSAIEKAAIDQARAQREQMT
jgi:hypothetical protein